MNYVRVSRRGRWHTVVRLIPRTRASQTRCGRIIPKGRPGGWPEATDQQPSAAVLCEKCLAA